MKKVIALSVLILLIGIVSGVRIFQINRTQDHPIIQKYELGEKIAVESDYFDNAGENAEGYSIRVLGTDILTKSEFCNRYGYQENSFMNTAYYLMVNIEINNSNNCSEENVGVYFGQFAIQNKSYYNFVNLEVTDKVLGVNGAVLSLPPKAIKNYALPFPISSEKELNDIINEDTKLVVSLFPHKNTVKLFNNIDS